MRIPATRAVLEQLVALRWWLALAIIAGVLGAGILVVVDRNRASRQVWILNLGGVK